MKILQSLGLKDKSQDKTEQDTKPVSNEQQKQDPHTQGGCCGSCGGQKQGQR